MQNLQQIKKKIKDLTEEINFHNDLYYNKDNPKISDFEYDIMYRQLQNLEKEYPQFKLKNSPTNKIGGVVSSSFEKIKHKIYMGSLQNAYSFLELLKFEERIKQKIENISYIIEPKVDGLSVSLEYVNGKFKRGSTRGDGFFGEDITENLKTINSIPKTLNKSIPFLEVRAEIYMPIMKFEELILKQKNLGEIPFKNPRNAAAGSLRQKNAFVTSTRGLKAICFNIQQIEGVLLKTHKEAIDLLTNLGFYTIPESEIFTQIKDCETKIEEIKNNKKYYDFEIDGAVIKINSLLDRKILGSNSKNPRWAIAFKYPPQEQTTTLKEIVINVGRTGVLTPIAIFDPVDVAKTTINKASLHNQDYIDKKDIRIGDLIVIRKAGEIIPEIVKSIKHEKNSKPYKLPTKCPVCGEKVFKIKTFYRCINPYCKATKLQNIIHFVSKEAMNIKGLGEQTIKTLVEKEMIEDVSDIYKLKKEDILKLEGFKEKSAENLLKAIKQSKKNPCWRLLFALGIKEVGQKTAKIICGKFKNISKIMNTPIEQFIEIKDIGEITAINITKYFSLKETKNLIKKLIDLGINVEDEKEEKNSKLKDISFAITGKFENIKREELKNKIEALSGKIVSSISKKTTYLIAGENPGSKLEKAKELKINILNENEILKLIEK